MRNNYLFIFVFTLFYSSSVFAQNPMFPELAPNLIPNPGFEKLSSKVNTTLESYLQFRKYMLAWRSPTRTTPDLILREKDNTNKGSGKNNDLPRSGKIAVAIITDNPQVADTRTDTYREYIQTKLKTPLKIGEKYHIEFWVKKSYNAKLVSNNIGFIFGSAPVSNTNYEALLNEPSYNHSEVINHKKTEWVKIETEFEATSDYTYLMIGNFYNNQKTKVKSYHEGEWNNAYYLIDDVNLFQMSNLESIPEPEPIEEIIEEPIEETIETMKVEVGKIVKLENIFFETAKSTLLPTSFEELDKLLILLNNNPTMEISIMGHTDSRGEVNYNLNLSINRAKAVYEYLLNNNIEVARLTFEGFGLERPVDTNDTAEGRQMNRRVEFMITKE